MTGFYSNAAAVTEAVAAREVDAAYSADIELKCAWRVAKHPANLVLGRPLARRALYIAASMDSPRIDRDAWAKAFDMVKRDGVVDRAYAYCFCDPQHPWQRGSNENTKDY